MPLCDPITKQPNERYTVSLDYSSKLPEGATIDHAGVSAWDLTNDMDASSELLSTTIGTVSEDGLYVGVALKGGIDGREYKVTVLATLSDGEVLEDDVTVYVRDS